jgi:hypothetical protein
MLEEFQGRRSIDRHPCAWQRETPPSFRMGASLTLVAGAHNHRERTRLCIAV